MKRILLTSTALVAFAGAAAAEVSWSAGGVLGYNDDIEGGIYADVDLDVTLSQELDNGVTVAATFGFELQDNSAADLTNGNFSDDANLLISVTSDTASLFFGDTAFAAETYWSGVTNMAEDSFSEADGETVLRGEMTFGAVTAGISYVLDTDETLTNDYDADPLTDDTDEDVAGTGDLEQLSLGLTGTFGMVTAGFAYQEMLSPTAVDSLGNSTRSGSNGDFNDSEVMGIFASANVGGADVSFAWAQENDGTDTESSTGIQVAYPIGPVTATVFYVSETAGDDSYGIEAAYASGPLTAKVWLHEGGDEDTGVNVSYDVGNGIMVYAGGSDDDGQYIGAEYDLGGGAKVIAAFAEDYDDMTNDEIGPQEYYNGTTIAVSFSF